MMRRGVPSILLLCLLGFVRVFAQFEGMIESKNITTDELGRPQEFVMTMWIKNDMARIETHGTTMPGSSMIYRTDLKKIWILNPEERTYFEIPQNEERRPTGEPPRTEQSYSVKRTGKKKTIAGYECEQFIIKGENEETELWGTRRLAHLVSTLAKVLGSEQVNAGTGAVSEIMKRGIYPMLSATKVDGQLIESQEVTRIEARTLDSSLFALPPDFKKRKSPELMQDIPDQRK